MARELRDYQREAADAVMHQWGGGVHRTAVVLPTGAGKSTVIAELAARAWRDFHLPVVMLAHRDMLLGQMAATVAEVDPALPPVGIVRGPDNQPGAPIVAASLQTLVNPARLAQLGRRPVVLWDEAHHAVAPSWMQVAVDLGALSGGYLCGFSATLRRDDGKRLRDLIETVAFERDLRWAIDHDPPYLVAPHGLTVRLTTLDLSRVRSVAGDYHHGELTEALESTTPEVVTAIIANTAGRRPIIFAAGVAQAHAIADGLNERGYPAEAVTGDMPAWQRADVFDRFRSGITRAMVTVQVLTEGADFPMCDTAVIARPTQSLNLYSQMVGRALRLWPGKIDALVLDLVGISRSMKLVTLTDLDPAAPVKPVDPEGNERELDPEETAGRKPPKLKRLGPIELEPTDLFSAHHTTGVWLASWAGTMFTYSLDSPVVGIVVPADLPGLYRAGWLNRDTQAWGWLDNARCWPLDVARDLVTDTMVEQNVRPVAHGARWRTVSKPTDGQIRYARSLGIIDPDNLSRARIADEIETVLVSRALGQTRPARLDVL